MRGLCGWVTSEPEGGVAAALAAMLDGGGAIAAEVERRELDGAALAAFGQGAARPRCIDVEGYTFAVCGHPRLVEGGNRSSDLTTLARALRDGGSAAVARLGGDFALAGWDHRQRRGLLAVDRIGVQPLAYGRIAGGLAFASSLDALRAHPGVVATLSQQSVFDYLYYHVCPGPETIYEGLRRLPAGHLIEFGARGAGEPRPYWTLQFPEASNPDLAALRAEFLGLLDAAVRESADAGEVGSFLSGGTDSSTVSGMLGRTSGTAARTFSIGFDVPGYDETGYARIAARHFACDHHEYYVKPTDVVDAIPNIATSYDQPFGNASAVPAYLCARYARASGITRLLAGDGGDELFGGNERYAKQHLLGMYQHVPAPLRRALVEPMLMSPAGRLPGLRKLRSYVEQARPAMPLRYESYNLLLHLGISEVLSDEFVAAIDSRHPEQLLVKTHAPHVGASLINQMLAIDLRFVLTDGDLPKVTHTCNLADIDVAFPLLDDRIVEFSQRLPSDMKLRGTKLRWFFKQALAEFLPREIITKKKHGFGLPVGEWLIGHQPLFDLAAESVKRLVPRGLVRREFVGDLFDRRLREHPGYYGTMVWVLMMLSLWLDSRRL